MIVQRKQIAILLVMVAMAQSACAPHSIRESRKAAHRIQVVTDAAIDTTATLFHDQVIDQAKKNQIATILVKVNTGNRVLIEQAAAATADTPQVRAQLLAQVRVIEAAVKELKDAGVLGIKSKNGTLAFETAISALDTSIAIIQAALGGK